MNYRRVKRFDKKISQIGFGAWQLGNSHDFDGMSFEKGIELVRKAVTEGITFFDTAPNYAEGNSEKILGEALKGADDEIFINTKIGHNHEGVTDFSIRGVTDSIYQSIENLQRTKLDSVILHNPESEILKGKTDHYSHLNSLKKDGIIDGYGVSIDTAEELRMVLDHSDVDVIELMFNLIHQSPKVWFDEVQKRDMLLVIKVPLDSGWLTGKYDAHSSFSGIRSRWTKDDIQQRAEIISDIKDIVGQNDLVSAALSFILSFKAVKTVIPGTRSETQLQSNVHSLKYELSKEMKTELENLYDSKISTLEIPW